MRENTTPPNGRATQPGANAGNAVNGRECRGRRGEWRVAAHPEESTARRTRARPHAVQRMMKSYHAIALPLPLPRRRRPS
ncbi:hypothetical protein BURPS1710A_A2039 [Burkholderia pseudomallei 1710a]|uniref:Uncharacterized protein n=1 Tax=Burkholderia pseudomallei 1710a TaxID=320371 RepID=A0A0E1VT42_BURPE|nr:hypothetical protein BURPS1710A_A2039 [Burkholderia pseudomallei 1710a]